jgi:transcription elongation GreA/GreB family factor
MLKAGNYEIIDGEGKKKATGIHVGNSVTVEHLDDGEKQTATYVIV